jgi:hypothetical protein
VYVLVLFYQGVMLSYQVPVVLESVVSRQVCDCCRRAMKLLLMLLLLLLPTRYVLHVASRFC